MKQTTFIFLLSLFLFLAESSLQSYPRKLESAINMTLMGFENAKIVGNSNINFNSIYKRLGNETFDPYLKLNTSITYLKNNSDPSTEENIYKDVICSYDNKTNFYNDYALYKCSIDNISYIKNVEIVDLEEAINTTDLAKETMTNILNETRKLYIFDLTDEITEKNNQFILKGNMHKRLSDYDSLDSFEIINNDIEGRLNCQKINNFAHECKLLATNKINNACIDNLEANSTGSKIYIKADNIQNKYISFPIKQSEKNATIFSIGNFTESTRTEDAKGTIFIKGGINKLIDLEKYMGFNVSITYLNKAGNEQKKNINVRGEKNSTDLYKGMISYELNYLDTKNSTIVKMESPSNIIFSNNSELNEPSNNSLVFEDKEYYAFLEDKIIDYIPMNLPSGDKAITTDDSFYFEFVDNGINVADSAVNLSCIPYDENRTFINCVLKNLTKRDSVYRIICSPKKSIYAPLNSVRIDITNLNKTSRLRILLEKGTNTSLFMDPETEGYIDYTYNPKLNGVFHKKNSGGLSGGEIAAIVIASVIAVLAVIFLLYFFNRPPATIIKNNNEIKLENSTTNINK